LEAVRVKVKYFSFFQNITGKDEEYIHLEKPDVRGLLELLERRYRAKAGNIGFGLSPASNRMEFMISVNGKSSDLECPLKDNDEVSLLPPMGGG
jgi:MoaD family protein